MELRGGAVFALSRLSAGLEDLLIMVAQTEARTLH